MKALMTSFAHGAGLGMLMAIASPAVKLKEDFSYRMRHVV